MARTDEQLMAAYVGGDSAALRELFTRYAPLLIRIVGRGLPRADDASDLVQQTFLQVHRARHDFKPGARLRPWMITIAVNLRRQYFRTRLRKPEEPLDLDGSAHPTVDPPDLDQKKRATRLQAAMKELKEEQREVIELHWFAGLSFPEVAETVGASTSAVKVRAHRGYAALRKILGTFDCNGFGVPGVSRE